MTEKQSRLEEKTFTGDFNGRTVWRIVKQTRPHLGLLAGFLIFILLTAFLDSFSTYLSAGLIDEGIMARNPEALRRYSLMIALTFVINAGSLFIFILSAGKLGELVQHDLREKLFNHLQELSFAFFDKVSSGWLLSRITSDSRRIAELASWMILDTVWGVFNILVALVFMSQINLKLALMMALVLPLLFFTAVRFKKRIIGEYRKVRSINSKITAAYSESINGVKVIKALAKEKANLSGFGRLTDEMYHASYRAAWLSAIFIPVVQLIISFGVGGILLFGGWQIELGTMTIGGLRAFIGYMTFMLWPIQELARVFSEMQQSIAGAERVFSLLDTPSDIPDGPGAVETVKLEGRVEFDQVSFHYVPGSPVLKDFSLTVEPGQTIALVGPTGGGKTTIASLLSRYYEPVSGRILMDGRDYREYTQRGLQSRIGVVLQKPHLFSGSVRDNILYGRPDATEEEMIQASRLAHAHQVIEKLPHRYDEEVGEEGTLLSMGQRQLISLARALLSNPDILVMDEATSSVDTLTEKEIQKGLEELLKGRTSFIIAHRLSTIREADRILVINAGTVEEAGTHQELLREKGEYYRLYTSQFRRERGAAVGVWS
jgi:ATP-binding cassette, subfamily B, bacterial